MKSTRLWLTAVLLATLLIGLVPQPSSAQLVVIDKKLLVTEIRADQDKIGVTVGGNASETRNWVKIEPSTRISYKLHRISRAELFRIARPGMVMRVHGGRDWDNNITAKEVWL